ncbi:serine protease [Pseudanabaena galeata UHCC 0370]|uniref:Serine protease n=1 Tax=Pseudanabaena galeata UHCC 0370 TaxID=3110310 RepID=A0ABU5TNG3_9CYAN|nr:serine protease [Pseudanabaena galeata]MEA5479553.1 serine protease [Pseudanabaena galeata UHCC 0370]
MASLSPDNLKTCTVKLSIDGIHGTGFFVAAGLILTCHHVVKNAGDRPIKVRWQNQEDFAVAKVLQSFPDPVDLALLQFETVETLACVELDGAIAAFDDLFAYGYPDIDPNGAGVVLRCDGLNGDVPPKIKFSDGRVRSGLSSAPLLNPATGKVCGVVKYTEDRSLPLGGGGIPIATVFEYFPDLATRNRQFHQQQRGDVNPFQYGAPVSPDRFYGRVSAIADIKNRIGAISAQCVNIVGLRRGGKSSFLRYIKERPQVFFQDSQQPLIVSLDLQDRRFLG